MTQMRAALYDEYGGPGVIHEGRLPVPVVGDDDVLVRVEATTVNGGELLMRAGKLRLISGRRFPLPLGIDFVGEVAAVGNAVTSTRIGDRVWGLVEERRRLGAAAEYAAVTAQQLSPAPANLTSIEAASLVVGGTTALTGLRDKAHLRDGERLLVRGAGGGVGSVAIQIGKLFGAHVTALAGGEQTDTLRSLGADEVIDYKTTTPAQLDRYDVIFDTRCTDLRAYRRLLAPGGRMVAIAFDIDHLASSLGTLIASTVFGRSRIQFFRGKPTHDLFAELTKFAENGQVLPVVHSVLPLRDMTSAHATLESGGVLGKIVIDVPGPQ